MTGAASADPCGCNTWTARVLHEAGLQTGLWNPLPISLSTSLALFNPDRLQAR